MASGMSIHDHQEEELDPAAERVRRKMVRLLAGSLGIMALGLIAVFAAIVYRIGQSGEADIAAPTAAREAAPFQAEAAIVLPDDTEIRSVGLDGDRALLLVREPQGEALILVDLASGAILARRPLRAGPDDSGGARR